MLRTNTRILLFSLFLFLSPIVSKAQCGEASPTSLYYQDFGSGTEQYSIATPKSLGYSTQYLQKFAGEMTNDSMFSLQNLLNNDFNIWHRNVTDHTIADEANGYMMVVNGNGNNIEIYKDTVNGLTIGKTYAFCAFSANIYLPSLNRADVTPVIRFEVRDTTGKLLASNYTQDLSATPMFTWRQNGVSFMSSTKKIIISLISMAEGGIGNDFAIDDIAVNDVSEVTARSQELQQAFFHLYPNPSNGEIQLESFDGLNVENITIKNSMGLEIYNRNYTGKSLSIDLKNLPKGIYFVIGKSADGYHQQKLILN